MGIVDDHIEEALREMRYTCLSAVNNHFVYYKDDKAFNISPDIWLGFEFLSKPEKGLFIQSSNKGNIIKAIEIFEWN